MPLETPRTYVNMAFDPEELPRRRFPHKRALAGAAALAALAVAGGFFLLPMIGHEPPHGVAPAPASSPGRASDNLNIVVDHTPPPVTAPSSQQETDVAPSPSPSVARPTVQPIAPPPPAASKPRRVAEHAPPPQVVRQPQKTVSPPAPSPVGPAPPPRVAEAPEVMPYTPTPPPTIRPSRSAQPSFNCRYARTTSEQMICSDPRLAAADRRMVRAYEYAIRRGVPEPDLRHQQDIWLGIRESAARDGPEGVARAYAIRTAQLRAMVR